MQVSQVNDHITHVVIGGAQTIEFGISNSAEFFNILSSTLYSDQILAVVREVLCNAWDAHIAADCKNTPVKVTFTDDSLIVRDFGLGIPHDQIGPIYGTYGNSTKKNDGQQTGGFGLGCKAPFAYTDQFEVVSSNNGIRTIYSISKSSAQAMGKPSITAITSFPTQETGLQVTIPIKNSSDCGRFRSLIEGIAYAGDMNVELDGEIVEKLGFPENQNFLIHQTPDRLTYPERVQVRYGNVIYPIPDHEKISDKIKEVRDVLDKASTNNRYHDNILIFQAPPHSIAVTPSRESLSMQDHTIHTILELFFTFLEQARTKLPQAIQQISSGMVAEAVQKSDYRALLNREDGYPYKAVQSSDLLSKDTLAEFEDIARIYMTRVYPSDWEYRKTDLAHRVNRMVQAKLLDSDIANDFIKELKSITSTPGWYYASFDAWFKKRVIQPVVKRIMKDTSGLLTVSNLYVYDADGAAYPKHAPFRSEKEMLIPAKEAHLRHTAMGTPYLRKILVITPTKRDFLGRARQHEVFTKYGNNPGYLVYYTGRSPKAADEARKVFAKSGFNIVDLTVRYSWDEPIVKTETKPRKKTPKGWPTLANALTAGLAGDFFQLNRCFDDNVERTETPEFYVRLSGAPRNPVTSLAWFSRLHSRNIANLYGKRGCVITSNLQEEKCIAKGAINLDKWQAIQVSKEIASNANILEYVAHWPKRFPEISRSVSSYLQALIWDTPEIRSKYGLVNNLTDQDKAILSLWEATTSIHWYMDYPEIKAVHQQLEAIPIDPINTDLLHKLAKNPLMELIDAERISRIMVGKDQAKKDRALTLLINAING